MDAALVVIAANQPCPQPQTAEHVAAAEIMNLKAPRVITLQTKADLVNRDQAFENQKQIREFARATCLEKSPLIPVSCTPNSQFNIDVLLEYLVETIPIPRRDFSLPPLADVIRSFDVNTPGTPGSKRMSFIT